MSYSHDDGGSEYYTSAWNKIGESHYRAKRHEDALECFKKVLNADPDNDVAQEYLQKIRDTRNTVCFETSIWISYMLGDVFSQKCKRTIDSCVHDNDSIIVISHMIIAEIILTLRRKIMFSKGSHKNASGNALKYSDIVLRRNEAKRMVNCFLNWLKYLSDTNNLVYYMWPIQLVNFEKAVFNRVKNYNNWNLIRYGYCKDCANKKTIEKECCIECKNKISTSCVRYRGLDYPDIQHAEMARLNHVQHFFTVDKSFRHLSGSEDFSRMDICIIDS